MKNGLDIAFFGSSPASAHWNGAADCYYGVLRALARRGRRVTFYEPDDYGRRPWRLRGDISARDWARVVVYEGEGEDGVLGALTEASSADLVIKAGAVGVFDELLERALIEMQRPGTLVAFWDVNAPATLDRLERNSKDPWRQLIPEYDLIFTYGGGGAAPKAYEAMGARMCAPIHCALDPATHYRVDPDPRFEADLGFLGNRWSDSEALVEEFFLRPAAAMTDHRFLFGGDVWEGMAVTPNVNCVGQVQARDRNAFNSTPRAMLNIGCDGSESLSRYGVSPAARIFEAAGAGACLITEAWEGVETFLEPGSEILLARDGDEVIELLASLTPERARAVGEASRRRILSEHTYDHRAMQVESLLDSKRMVFVEIA